MKKCHKPKKIKITSKSTLSLKYLFLRQAFGNFSLLFKVVENGKGVDVLDSVVVARVHVDARETKPFLILLKNDIGSIFTRFFGEMRDMNFKFKIFQLIFVLLKYVPVGHVNRVVVLDSRHFGGFVAVWMSG